MFPLALVHTKSQELDLPYLLIGGHAVNTYAEPRATLDVDFLIRQEDEPHWRRMILAEGFSLHRDAGNFVQFSPPYGVNWRLDFMLVNAATFEKLQAGSRPVSCLGIATRVPSPQHLIALKLHAMVNGPPDRFEKDFGDIVSVARSLELDPDAAALKEIFSRYGKPEIYEQFRRRLGKE